MKFLKFSVKLGDYAKDSISGFEGIVYGLAEYLYGCRRVGLKPKNVGKDGKPIQDEWFDEGQIVGIKVDRRTRNGGPMDAPTKIKVKLRGIK